MKALTIWRPYVAGVLHGDGWCTEKSLGLRVKDKDFADAFATAMNGIMQTNIGVRRDERGYWTVRASNRTGRFTHLRGYEPLNNEERAMWLRGFFDSEGNAQILKSPSGPNSWHRRVAFYSTNLVTLGIAAAFLHHLDIAHSISVIKNSKSHKGKKPVSELRLRRRAAFQRFAVYVGSNIARKQHRLEQIGDTYQPEGWQARNWAKAIASRYPHLAEGRLA